MLELFIDGIKQGITWEDNASVRALTERAKGGDIHVRTHRYGGFEQVGDLPFSLPRNDSQTTTRPGDVVLYCGDSIVVFFGSNSWAYTRLGHLVQDDRNVLNKLLNKAGVEVVIRYAK